MTTCLRYGELLAASEQEDYLFTMAADDELEEMMQVEEVGAVVAEEGIDHEHSKSQPGVFNALAQNVKSDKQFISKDSKDIQKS